MKAVRLLLLIAALGGSLVWLYWGGGKARFAAADPWFLDFLVANARTKIEKDLPSVSEDVALIQFREEDKAEYSTWPPAPLDYIMVLKRIAPHEPEVVAFTESLRWETETPEFLMPLRQSLVAFPSVVFGFEVGTGSGAPVNPEAEEFIKKEMPSLSAAENSIEEMAAFSQILTLPARTLRVVGQMGISHLPVVEGDANTIPILARNGEKVVPSVAAQAITLFRRAPYSVMRLRLGAGARLSLGDRYIIPLDPTASIRLQPQPTVPIVNALELLTPELGAAYEQVTKSTLGKKKIIVISRSPEGLTQARAIAAALTAPAFYQAPLQWEWVIAGVTCLLALWQSRRGRFGVLMFGFGVLVLGMVTSLLVFQTALAWCSPLPVLAVVATSTLVCFLWPHVRVATKVEVTDPAPA